MPVQISNLPVLKYLENEVGIDDLLCPCQHRLFTHLSLPRRVVDGDRPVVHAHGEQSGVSLREVQAGHPAVGADRALRVLGVANLTSTRDASHRTGR